MEGNGEILHIEAKPADGERELSIDKQTGLIDGEDLQDSARALSRGPLWRQQEPTRHDLRRRPRSGVDPEDSRRPQARACARQHFS